MASAVGACLRRGPESWLSPVARRSFLALAAAAPPRARPGRPGLPGLPFAHRAAASCSPPARFYSSDSERDGQRKPSVFMVKIPNPLSWLRSRFYIFLIRAYFDQEFSIHEFTEGAKQAFTYVSRLISQCKYDLLEELVSKEVIQVLKEKLALLSENHKHALAATMDEIMFTAPGDVGIYYDDSGRKFVSILVRFWYFSSADLPDDGIKMIRFVSDNETERKTKHLLTASYEFRREFTEGVKPDWTITRIEHASLLE
ncbi:m-AAA protease-interacting protein 1, mitochondrial [Pogona vitticeps]